jgi:hypothetical protein
MLKEEIIRVIISSRLLFALATPIFQLAEVEDLVSSLKIYIYIQTYCLKLSAEMPMLGSIQHQKEIGIRKSESHLKFPKRL